MAQSNSGQESSGQVIFYIVMLHFFSDMSASASAGVTIVGDLDPGLVGKT